MTARRSEKLLIPMLVAVLSVVTVTESVDSAPTVAQRRELSAARRTITRASLLIRRKKFDEAEKTLSEAEAAIKKVIDAAKLKPTDRSVAGLLRFLALQQRQLTIKRGGKPKPATSQAVSFVKDVAPILGSRCGNCHAARAAGRTPPRSRRSSRCPRRPT